MVCLDRRKGAIIDEDGVVAKFGVSPKSIPDYLGLVGDAADGIPGIARWGAKSTSQALHRYGRIEDMPLDASEWDVKIRGLAGLVRNLSEGYEDALLYKRLATLRTDVPMEEGVADLEWRGVKRGEFERLCGVLDAPRLMSLPHLWDEG